MLYLLLALVALTACEGDCIVDVTEHLNCYENSNILLTTTHRRLIVPANDVDGVDCKPHPGELYLHFCSKILRISENWNMMLPCRYP